MYRSRSLRRLPIRLSHSVLVIGFTYGVRENSLVLPFSTLGYLLNCRLRALNRRSHDRRTSNGSQPSRIRALFWISSCGVRRAADRVGINSGPVVAGIIGRKKFTYDLWGESVNLASRMESHGRTRCIQITRSTHELIEDAFNCEAVGLIEVKGVGHMEVWHVLGRKKPATAAATRLN
jgi:Adenylate and Guanylate cyclase catalytic domain